MTTYQPGHLDLDKTYYWRVDGSDKANANSPRKGRIWSFTVVEFIVVNDFESYSHAQGREVWWTWIDGFGTTTNGAIIGCGFVKGKPMGEGYDNVCGGVHAMPYHYESKWKTSQATRSFTSSRDWTQGGVARLSSWFHGDPANAPEPMYVALNGTAPVYHDDPAAATIGAWTEWIIDLRAFEATLTNVTSMTIGFGIPGSTAAGGTGYVVFDDIRLYPSAP